MSNVKKIINEWDPIQLLAIAPSDEYDFEIQQIEAVVKETSDVKKVASVIYYTFTEAFGGDVFKKTMDECIIIASEILQSC